jgi:hypothetical protein
MTVILGPFPSFLRFLGYVARRAVVYRLTIKRCLIFLNLAKMNHILYISFRKVSFPPRSVLFLRKGEVYVNSKILGQLVVFYKLSTYDTIFEFIQ